MSFCDADVRDRFWAKVTALDATECWEWQAGCDNHGYGSFTVYIDGVKMRRGAHRVSYELRNGSIPSGLVIDHLCRNPKCVNPLHLEAVTTAENVLRGLGPTARNARKTACDHGHPLIGVGASVRVRKNGSRICRPCDSARKRELRRQKKAERLSRAK